MINFKKSYKSLTRQSLSVGDYSIVPIRYEDRFDIMQWRNEQMYHLRQNSLLTIEDQENYFQNVVANLFDQERPGQILFSYLRNEECIGYGGLVHINWIDRNAEISFVQNTSLEQNEFHFHWGIFLDLIEIIAFEELKLHKLFTYAFDLRPHLYEILELKMYWREAVLKEHCFFDHKFVDVVIHSKINTEVEIVEASLIHAKLLFDWANEQEVRNNSFNSKAIIWENHIKWLNAKIESNHSYIFIFFVRGEPIGQVRLDFEIYAWLIDFSVDKRFRGKGYGTMMLNKIIDLYDFKELKAQVKAHNKASFSVFRKLGFIQKTKQNKGLVEFYLKKQE